MMEPGGQDGYILLELRGSRSANGAGQRESIHRDGKASHDREREGTAPGRVDSFALLGAAAVGWSLHAAGAR
jgi:hypothetical protein